MTVPSICSSKKSNVYLKKFLYKILIKCFGGIHREEEHLINLLFLPSTGVKEVGLVNKTGDSNCSSQLYRPIIQISHSCLNNPSISEIIKSEKLISSNFKHT